VLDLGVKDGCFETVAVDLGRCLDLRDGWVIGSVVREGTLEVGLPNLDVYLWAVVSAYCRPHGHVAVCSPGVLVGLGHTSVVEVEWPWVAGP